jgi:DNA modification methylase
MTELIWDGKYKDEKKQGPVRIALPFQTIETVNEGTEARYRALELFAAGRETEWRNRLIWGDKKYVLPSLLPEFAGKVNLIYIDPPFATGADFSFTATIPDHPDADEGEASTFTKEPSILEQKAYRDTWGRGLDSYLQWFYETALFLRELLSDDGSLYVHIDWHVGDYVKVVLDEVFGLGNSLNEIRWRRIYSHSDAKRFGIVDDTILFYAKSERWTFNKQYRPHSESYIESHYGQVDKDGRSYRLVTLSGAGPGPPRRFGKKVIPPPKGRHWAWSQARIDEGLASGKIVFASTGQPNIKQYLDETEGTVVQTIWDDIQPVNPISPELLGYDTQKPEALLERIIKASSNEGDLVLDCFVGSGTTAAVAEKLNRRWIACDLGRFAIHTTRKRLLGIPNVRPFVVQNLGKYERQAWQAAEFGVRELAPAFESGDKSPHSKELAYRKFILDLYHATPITGRTWLHGAKAGRMVHVGAVDAPVTLADVKAIAKEVWKGAGTGKDAPPKASVDILGWEFAFELNETAKQVAAESRVEVAFKKIPHEALDKKAVEQGDIKFFELGALSVDVKVKRREVRLELTDFVIPIDDIPAEVRKAIKHWSQMVDYWAVDWDYKGDTFHNQWQSYRTRKNPKIELERTHTYPEPGKYMIVVKVIDLLGNDTTKTLEVRVG